MDITIFNLTSTIMAAISAYHQPYNVSSPSKSLTARQFSLPSTGPYPAISTTTPSLPEFTLYQPQNLSSVVEPVRIIVWGNSACEKDSTDQYAEVNLELASQGFMVMACGDTTTVLNFITAKAGINGYEKLSKDRIGLLGTSCGGAAVYEHAEDPRIASLAIFDAGNATTDGTHERAANTTKPVFWFVTDETEVATQGITKPEYDAVEEGVPAWMGMLPGTDVKTLGEGGAGKVGRVADMWANWVLKGNATAGEYFLEATGAESEGWSVMRKSLEKVGGGK